MSFLPLIFHFLCKAKQILHIHNSAIIQHCFSCKSSKYLMLVTLQYFKIRTGCPVNFNGQGDAVLDSCAVVDWEQAFGIARLVRLPWLSNNGIDFLISCCICTDISFLIHYFCKSLFMIFQYPLRLEPSRTIIPFSFNECRARSTVRLPIVLCSLIVPTDNDGCSIISVNTIISFSVRPLLPPVFSLTAL